MHMLKKSCAAVLVLVLCLLTCAACGGTRRAAVVGIDLAVDDSNSLADITAVAEDIAARLGELYPEAEFAVSVNGTALLGDPSAAADTIAVPITGQITPENRASLIDKATQQISAQLAQWEYTSVAADAPARTQSTTAESPKASAKDSTSNASATATSTNKTTTAKSTAKTTTTTKKAETTQQKELYPQTVELSPNETLNIEQVPSSGGISFSEFDGDMNLTFFTKNNGAFMFSRDSSYNDNYRANFKEGAKETVAFYKKVGEVNGKTVWQLVKKETFTITTHGGGNEPGYNMCIFADPYDTKGTEEISHRYCSINVGGNNGIPYSVSYSSGSARYDSLDSAAFTLYPDSFKAVKLF